jgi:hypothetical protein
MSTGNLPSAPSSSKRRTAMIIALIPAGAILGFLGGLLSEIIVGLITGRYSSLIIRRGSPGASSVRYPALGIDRRNLGTPSCTRVRVAANRSRPADTPT